MAKKNAESLGGLSEPETQALKLVSDSLQLKGKSLQELKDQMEMLLVEDEKDSIYRFEEIEEKVQKLLQELGSTEEKLKKFEGTVTGFNEEFGSLFRRSEIVNRQNEFIEIRQNNQMKLLETLKLLFSGIELTKEEKASLVNPSFSSQENIEDLERVLEKIAKFLKYSREKYQTFKGFKAQLDEVGSFLKQFLAKLREQFRVLAKKAAGKLGEEDLQESRVPDTSELRRGLMGLRRIVFSLISINAEEKGFFQIIMKDVASVISLYFMTLYPKYLQLWQKDLEALDPIHSHWAYNIQGELPMPRKEDLGLNLWLEDLVLHLRGQIESDEGYFAKFWSWERKMTAGDDEVREFMEEGYRDFYKKIEEFFGVLLKNSIFVVFLLEARIRQFLGEKESENKAYSRGFFRKLVAGFGKKKEDLFKGFGEYLEGMEVDTRHCGVLLVVKNFIRICGGLGWELTLEGDVEGCIGDLVRMFELLVKFLQKNGKKKEKYEDVLLFGNLYFMVKEAEIFNNPLTKSMVGRLKPLLQTHSENYSRYLLAYNSTKFMDFWLNIKKLSASEINSDSKYSKSAFNKLLKSTFGNVHKSLEKIVKRLKKQLAKDPVLVSKGFENYSDFVLRELREVERFFEIHYNDQPTIRKAEVEGVLIEKRKMLV